MNKLTIAVIADVHGNSRALEAVLQDIQTRQVDRIINLGDSVYGPMEPGAAAERLMQSDIISIAGNVDVIFTDPPEAQSPTYQHVLSQLTSQRRAWLANLPATYSEGEIFACHGTPDSNETSLLEDITPNGVFLASVEQISKALEGIHQRVILCGHTHIPRTVWLPDGRLVVNPGSVGLPAYDHDEPCPHKMESGSPHARYAVLTQSQGNWQVEQIAVPYDWQAAAETARKHGREDYFHYLSTGRAGVVD
jgi:putative phosphoesterase